LLPIDRLLWTERTSRLADLAAAGRSRLWQDPQRVHQQSVLTRPCS
jgi:hypothetical protein